MESPFAGTTFEFANFHFLGSIGAGSIPHATDCLWYALRLRPDVGQVLPLTLSSFPPFSAFIALGLVAWVDPLNSGLWCAVGSWLAFGLFIGFLPWSTLAVLRLGHSVYNC